MQFSTTKPPVSGNGSRVLPLVILLLLGGCSSPDIGPATGPSADEQLEAGVMITTFKPLAFTVEHRKWDVAFFSDEVGDLDIPEPVARKWKTKYAVFSRGLVEAAKKAKLHAGSLAKILEIIQGAEENRRLAVLPVPAHETMLDGELVWAVALYWENETAVKEGAGMGHQREFIFTQKTFKQVGFSTCG